MKTILKKWQDSSLILRILLGLIVGVILGLAVPNVTVVTMLGSIFVSALKSVAPLLVFVLVLSSLANASSGIGKRFRTVIGLYLVSTFLAALVAVVASFAFPITMTLKSAESVESAPGGVGEVLSNLLTSMVSNPIAAISEANYIGVLFWAVLFGISLKKFAKPETLHMFSDLSDTVSNVVRWIIQFAPFGICGLVYSAVSESGISIFKDYGKLIIILVASMLVVSLIVNPLIIFLTLRRNPYPLVFTCIRESGLTAFFTRSSAANIPVNMDLCARLGLEKDFYSVSIPLGSTINMDGAAVTITIMTLTLAHTLGISVDFPSAVLLSVLATIGACGSSGVAGGSLLLIPMACSMFGVSNDIAMQAVEVGFIISVIQDSMETALNSSGDVLFTAAAEFHEMQKQGKEIAFFKEGLKKRQ